MNYTELSDGITHIEDLPTREFIEVLNTFDQYEITEKVDGAQLLCGIDSTGFYTSRESKGGNRYYHSENYGMKFSESYMRSAHLALEAVLPLLQAAGLTSGCQVEVEVLYGETPNVVQYSADINYIIFLRTTAGHVDIDHLNVAALNCDINVSAVVPYTFDGYTIELREEVRRWKFARSAKISVNISNLSNIMGYVTDMSRYLNEPSGIYSLPNSVIEAVPVNKVPEWCQSSEWKHVKPLIQALRNEIRDKLHNEYKAVIKTALLDSIVKNRPSQFGPSITEGGWIEGVVLKHSVSGHTVKLVDKGTFLKIKDACWQVRNQLIEPAKSADTARSIMARTLVNMAVVFGHPLLGTIQSKSYLKKIGESTQCRIDALVSDIDVNAVTAKWISILSNSVTELIVKLAEYEENVNTISSITGTRPCCLSPAVITRTKETFAETFTQIKNWIKILKTSPPSAEQLAYMIAGKKLNELHDAT